MAERLIGGLTPEQLVALAVEKAHFYHVGKPITEYELKLMEGGAVAGAWALWRELVALGKDLLDPEHIEIADDSASEHWSNGCRCLWEGKHALSDDGGLISKMVRTGAHPDCPVHTRRQA